MQRNMFKTLFYVWGFYAFDALQVYGDMARADIFLFDDLGKS
jgi:hypothetical protein